MIEILIIAIGILLYGFDKFWDWKFNFDMDLFKVEEEIKNSKEASRNG
jgi:hypothetical protein